MKRMYVIMSWDNISNSLDQSVKSAEPVDVVSSMERAEQVCLEMESEYPEFIFYWREVISSED